MTVRLYRLSAADGRQQALGDALAQLAGQVRPLPGCQGVELLRDVAQPGAYAFIERWASPEAYQAASARIPKGAFAPVLAALAGPPDVALLDTLPLA